MRKMLIIIGIIAMLSFVGCSSDKAGKATGTTSAPAVITATGDAAAGSAGATATTVSGKDWCQQGAKWHIEGTGTDLTILEMENAGKYAGYCHATYTLSSGGVSSTIHYFLKQDGSGYKMFEVDGKKYELPLGK